VQTLDDGEAVTRTLGRGGVRRAVVVGGGYIGVEMAEALPGLIAVRRASARW
jgi:NADPH-dependent 2,4-dienoyl-CoA reductase/sulfur reductase-like enzyme